MIFEIRDYFVDPAAMPQYERWVCDLAVPYIRKQLDLVGFWIATDDPVQVTGSALDGIGAANVTWVLRWADVEERNRRMGECFGPGSAEWASIASHHPGRQHYRRIQSRYARGL